MRRFLLALALSVTATLTGCGGDDGPDDSPRAMELREVAETTRDLGSVRVTAAVRIKTESEGEKKDVTVKTNGLWSFARNEGHLTVETGGVTTDQITKGGVLYAKLPKPPDPAKPWTRTPAKSGARVGTSDPEQPLVMLEGARDVKPPRPETVGGAETKRYDFVVDVSDAAASLPDGDRQAFESSLKSFDDRLPATVWVDGEGRMRQFRYTAVAEKGARVELRVTTTFADFGVEVAVEPPPADQIGKGA